MNHSPYRARVLWENIHWEKVEEKVETLQMQLSDIYPAEIGRAHV